MQILEYILDLVYGLIKVNLISILYFIYRYLNNGAFKIIETSALKIGDLGAGWV